MNNLSNPPAMQMVTDLLAALANGRRVLASFDLDSTLFTLRHRTRKIVEDFHGLPHYRRLYPEQCQKLERFDSQARDWGLKEPLLRAGIDIDRAPDFHQVLVRHWRERFFSNDYLHLDEPIAGAVEFVQLLAGRGVFIQYLTGRDLPRMWRGTLKSLRECGFPVDGAEVVLKPHSDLDDAEFKLEVLRNSEKKFDHIWFFENEPMNLNPVALHLPKTQLVFLDTTHSGQALPPQSAITIADFSELIKLLK